MRIYSPTLNAWRGQIADADEATVPALNSLMSDGWELTLGDALRLEGDRASAYVKGVDFASMEARLQQLKTRANQSG